MAPAKKPGQFERVFHRFDEDGDGKITAAELKLLVKTIGGALSLRDVEAAIESADSDGDGLLALDEFIELVNEGGEEEDRELREAFRMYEMEGQGYITPVSLRRMLGRLGTSRDIDECRAMIHPFDLNGDGMLSFDEFKVMML